MRTLCQSFCRKWRILWSFCSVFPFFVLPVFSFSMSRNVNRIKICLLQRCSTRSKGNKPEISIPHTKPIPHVGLYNKKFVTGLLATAASSKTLSIRINSNVLELLERHKVIITVLVINTLLCCTVKEYYI
jgi:hypothetical protein